MVEGLDIFRAGRLQAGDFNNQSVNLSSAVRFFAVAKNPPTSAGYLHDGPPPSGGGGHRPG
jgi:hypothetical protein